jgi:CheY-like chemotaxis protein
LEKSSQTGPDPLFVLVVEDEVLLRYEMVEYLRDSGCLLLEASTAKEAVAMCCDGNVLDVLLTDINLEGPGSGWDVADALRAVDPVLASSTSRAIWSIIPGASLVVCFSISPTERLTSCGRVGI